MSDEVTEVTEEVKEVTEEVDPNETASSTSVSSDTTVIVATAEVAVQMGSGICDSPVVPTYPEVPTTPV